MNAKLELDESDTGERVMVRVGKHAAGRVLDGRTHDAFPVSVREAGEVSNV